MKTALIILNTKKKKNTWKNKQIPPSVSCGALRTDKKTKKRVNKLTHKKMNKCMPIVTFLVLDVPLTPPVGVASGFRCIYGSNPKILEEYIHNILHYTLLLTDSSPFVLLCMAASLVSNHLTSNTDLREKKQQHWIS